MLHAPTVAQPAPPRRHRPWPVPVRPSRAGVLASVLAGGGTRATAAPALLGSATPPGLDLLWQWGLPLLTLALLCSLAFIALNNQALRRARRREQQAREDAERRVQARAQALAYLSHELRGTLGALGTGARLVNEGLADPRFQRELLLSMQQAGQQLLQVLENVLDHERGHAGQWALRPGPVDLLAWWQATMAPLRLAARTKGLHLQEQGPLHRATAEVDAWRLAQVLNNLVHNAIKFTPSGAIRVSLHADPQRLRLRVADEGPGIPIDQQHRIFEPYQQGGAGHRNGVGLGLAICRQIVAAMGGRLHLDSRAGQGSTFTVELPLPSPAQPPAAEAAAAPAQRVTQDLCA